MGGVTGGGGVACFTWFVLFACSQVLELTKEWTNKWNETQNILKVRRVVLARGGLWDAEL